MGALSVPWDDSHPSLVSLRGLGCFTCKYTSGSPGCSTGMWEAQERHRRVPERHPPVPQCEGDLSVCLLCV